MFLKYFGFREQPFGVTPDPRFLYLIAAHQEAVASLVVLPVEDGGGAGRRLPLGLLDRQRVVPRAHPTSSIGGSREP